MSLGTERVEPPGVLTRLGAMCETRGLGALADRLRALVELTATDLLAVETLLAELPRGTGLVLRSAMHLLDLGGKRLRPLCVALASRVGTGFGETARELAVAVELVHSATLLHDDVVDFGELRRGAPTARSLYGNAASIFAGDWLLVEALSRVRAADIPGTLDRLLGVIREMILAESRQLEQRGRIVADREAYMEITVGKTASLFRWGMFAGARAGGLPEVQCEALEAYGTHLGIAFQVVDDLLDFAGDPATTGKLLFTDLREGKMTYPLILGCEREPALKSVLETTIGDENVPEDVSRHITTVLESTGSLADCRAFAHDHARRAIADLTVLAPSEARTALETVAAVATERNR